MIQIREIDPLHVKLISCRIFYRYFFYQILISFFVSVFYLAEFSAISFVPRHGGVTFALKINELSPSWLLGFTTTYGLCS